MKCKISIIIPVYNAENYIKAALESIVGQTIGLEFLEVIMVDDYSTDKSGEIIDEYAKRYENFKSIHLLENSGASGKPRNIAIERSNGEYLMFLDADDYYAPDACEILYDKIVAEDVDIVFSNYTYVFENRTQKSHTPFGKEDEIKVKTIDYEPRLYQIPPSIWTKIIKREFIEDNDINFPEGIPATDLVFIVHAFMKANGITYLNNYSACNYNRLRDSRGDESISRNKNKQTLMGMIRAYNQTFMILKKHGKEDYFSLIFNGHLQFWAEGFILSDLKTSKKKELLKEISPLFEEFNKYDIKPKKYLIPLFGYISENRYDKAIAQSEELRHIIKNENRQQRSNIHNFLYKSQNFARRLKNNRRKILNRLLIQIRKPYKQLQYRFYPTTVDYKKLTIIIPYRKTTDPYREMNLDITLKYLSKIGILNLIVSEDSDYSRKEFLNHEYENLFDSFQVIHNNAKGEVFNRAKARNIGIIKANTPYVATSDLDCITKKKILTLPLHY